MKLNKIKDLINKKTVVRIIFVLILLTISLFGYKNIGKIHKITTVKFNNKSNTSVEQVKINNDDTLYREENNLKIEGLRNELNYLRNEMLTLYEEVNSLKEEIIKVGNKTPVQNTKDLQIMATIYKIYRLHSENKDFVDEFEYLKSLTKNDNKLYDIVIRLEAYKIPDEKDVNIIDVFKEEYKQLLTINNRDNNKQKQNILKTFIDDNIKIRKITDDENDNSKIDALITNIEKNIKYKNYTEVIRLIENSDYRDKFKETYGICKNSINFTLILDEIMENIN
ncbi:MAG: hypothetical protein IJ853_04125 [Rickettsiales bacterium]|nr:hypothetical protein [Rickettsiales bacterium]